MGRPSNNGWFARAACAGADHSLFIGYVVSQLDAAASICEACPVRAECLATYMHTDCVSGGFSYYERLLRSWKKVGSVDESNWGSIY